jgi:hypothetical protein
MDDRLIPPDGPKYIPSVLGYYYPGTFVRLSRGLIGLFVCALPEVGSTTIQVEVLRPFDEAEYLFKIARNPIDDPNLVDVQEVVRSGVHKNVDVGEVEDIVFVFHLMKVTRDFPHVFIQGMQNVYLCRFNSEGHHVDPEHVASFPSEDARYIAYQIQCPNKDIWYAIVAMQGELRRLLGRISEKQGLFSKNKGCLRISPMAWNYMKRQCHGKIATREGTRYSYKRILENGLTLSSVKCTSPTSMLRFETTEEISVFTSIFGNTAVVDVRKRRPRKGEKKEIIRNDSINIVVGAVEREEPFTKRTSKDGIDFTYDGDELAINVRYSLYILQRNRLTRDLIECPCELLKNIIERKGATLAVSSSDDDSDVRSVNENDEFTIGDRLYRVVEVHRDSHVLAKCIYPIRGNEKLNTVERIDNVEHVKNLINNN